MSHREQCHTFLEENADMRKFQEFLRAHCYDIAAYFISTTGLLFPRQAIAGEAQSLHLTAYPTNTPAIIFVSRQMPFTGCVYWNTPQNLLDLEEHSCVHRAFSEKPVTRESGGQLSVLIGTSKSDTSDDGVTLIRPAQ